MLKNRTSAKKNFFPSFSSHPTNNQIYKCGGIPRSHFLQYNIPSDDDCIITALYCIEIMLSAIFNRKIALLIVH